MNLTSTFGVGFGIFIVYYSIAHSGLPLEFFIEQGSHGIVIVMGGTLTVALISYPFPKILSLLKVFALRVIGAKRVKFKATINDILELNKKASVSGPTSLAENVAGLKHPFLKEAVEIVAAGVLSEKEIRETLDQRVKTTEERLMNEANMFASIGRFPPAFGLLAATLGMIALLTKIGQPGSEKLIGPAMAIGLVGTFYGISFANFILLPIAESLKFRTEEEIALRKMIVEGAVLLKKQTNPMAARESLNSFVMPSERVERKAA